MYSVSTKRQNGFFPNAIQPTAWANAIEHSSSWEANDSWTSQEITRILWNPKDYYRIHKSPTRVHILSQINSLHALSPYSFFEIYFNTLLLPTLRASKRFLSLRSPHLNRVCNSPASHTRYMPCPSHSAWFAHPNSICWAVQIAKPQSCSLLHSPLTSRPKCLPQHPILEHLQPAFLPQCERLSFTPIQNNRQNPGSLYLNLYIFG